MPPKSLLTEPLIADLCQLFDLLGDKTRLKIVLALIGGARNVGQLCGDLKLAQPTVSHHLSLLRMGKVISNSRKGKEVHYSLNGDFLEKLAGELLEQYPGGDKSGIRAGRFLLRRGGRAPTSKP